MNLKIELPQISNPIANYVAYKKVDNLLYVSGQVCKKDGIMLFSGKIGKDLTLDEGKKAARLCGFNILAQVKDACGGDLSRVKSCVRLNVFVNSAESFYDYASVANGASDLMSEVFGEDIGKPTRIALGVYGLPSNSAVEIDAIFAIA